MSRWAAADAVDSDFLFFATTSCENAVDALARVSRVLAQEIRLAVAQTMSAYDGTGTVADAAVATEAVWTAIPYGGRAAYMLAERPTIGGATGFAELVRDTAADAIAYVGIFQFSVLDVEADAVDAEALAVWGPQVLDVIAEFDSLGSRSWSSYCP